MIDVVIMKDCREREKSMKIFISQPMKDKTEEEIFKERVSIIRTLEDKYDDFEIIDSYFDKDCDYSPLECLGKSIILLDRADLAVFPKGYEKARGCNIEHSCAKSYGIPILYL